eukprot:jgi/Chrzof1/379/Cz01g13220.t1
MLTPLMQQTPSSLAQAERLLDEVDRCLLDLLPAGTPSEQQGVERNAQRLVENAASLKHVLKTFGCQPPATVQEQLKQEIQQLEEELQNAEQLLAPSERKLQRWQQKCQQLKDFHKSSVMSGLQT